MMNDRKIWAEIGTGKIDVETDAEVEEILRQSLGRCYNCPGYAGPYVGCVADPCLKERR